MDLWDYDNSKLNIAPLLYFEIMINLKKTIPPLLNLNEVPKLGDKVIQKEKSPTFP